jgi:hypothetical protein
MEDLIPTKVENIRLEYPVAIERLAEEGDSQVFFADGCEFFMDEHSFQWVKFVAKNGYYKGNEHMIRTDSPGFTVIRTGDPS